jgi:Holliday junction resolvasome RuvABC endonuclease subunit
MEAVLAIDTGTKTGFCVYDGEIKTSGVVSFAIKKKDKPGLKFLRFRQWLETMIDDHRPDVIIYEEAFQAGSSARRCYYGFTTRLEETVCTSNIRLTSVHSGTLKKYICGKGNAEKAEMIAAIRSKTGLNITEDNEADAIALALYYVS